MALSRRLVAHSGTCVAVVVVVCAIVVALGMVSVVVSASATAATSVVVAATPVVVVSAASVVIAPFMMGWGWSAPLGAEPMQVVVDRARDVIRSPLDYSACGI